MEGMKKLALLLVLAVAALMAQPADVDIPFEKFTLSNGLTVIVHEDHKAPIVAVNIWYHVGSKNEKRGKTGFAHLFEHLMFNGSEHFNSDYFKVLEKIGATDLNGTTSEDRTNYFQNVPTSALDTALWMESDRMGYLLGVVDQARLDEQRGVVQNEKRQGENEPYGLVYNLIPEATYPAGHPYSWNVIGSMDDLNAASLADVKEWFKTYYGPSNATLVLAGDIDLKTAREKAEKYFGALPPGPPVPHFRSWIAKMEGSRRQVLQDRVPQARIYKVWNIPQIYTFEGDMLDLASDVLATGKTSRLQKRLVYDEQIATSVQAYVALSEIGGQFVVIATAKPGGDLAAVEKAIDEEMAKFLRDGPTAEELSRIKTIQLAAFLRGVERIGGFGGKSDVLATGQVFAGDPAAYKKNRRNVSSATVLQVRDAARKWLSDGVYILEVQPFPDWKPSAVSSVDRSKVPEPGAVPGLRLPEVKERVLSNGLKLKVAERHELPLVSMQLFVNAGYASDQFGQPGTARLAMAVMDEGTKLRNSQQIADQLERLGATLGTSSALDYSYVTMSALKANLDASLEIYADVILNPAFPNADFEREKKQLLAAIQREKSEPDTAAMRLLPGLLFGTGHPYGNPTSGSGNEASVGRITRAELAKFHETWFRPNNATLIVAGDTTLAEIAPKLERLLAAWKSGEVPKKNLATVAQPSRPVVYLVDKPGALQSYIVAGQVAPPKGDRDDIAFDGFNFSFGEAFSSRINMNLREDKKWSYGAGIVLNYAVGQRSYYAYAPVQTDKTKESVVELNKEMNEVLRGRPMTAEEIAMAKDGLVLSMAGSRETVGSVVNAVSEVARYGLPQDYWQTYAGKVRALTSADFSAAAERLLKPDRLAWVIVGDREKIEAGIRALNLGEVRVVDGDGNPVQ